MASKQGTPLNDTEEILEVTIFRNDLKPDLTDRLTSVMHTADTRLGVAGFADELIGTGSAIHGSGDLRILVASTQGGRERREGERHEKTGARWHGERDGVAHFEPRKKSVE